MAGALFVLPSVAILWLLSYIYLAFGDLAAVEARIVADGHGVEREEGGEGETCRLITLGRAEIRPPNSSRRLMGSVSSHLSSTAFQYDKTALFFK